MADYKVNIGVFQGDAPGSDYKVNIGIDQADVLGAALEVYCYDTE